MRQQGPDVGVGAIGVGAGAGGVPAAVAARKAKMAEEEMKMQMESMAAAGEEDVDPLDAFMSAEVRQGVGFICFGCDTLLLLWFRSHGGATQTL